MRRTQRSDEAREYRKWYKTARWRKIRQHQLAVEPLCRMCSQQGYVTVATVCDHITPHKGDEVLFFNGPFQSLCKLHHDGAKQSEERTGKAKPLISVDGWPV